jgi:hypothetical protein
VWIFFYKTLQNQIGFIYHSKMLLNPFIEGEIRQGNGKAYGFEMALKKTQGRFTGQISYAFTRSLLKIPELFQDEYPARQDKPVDFSVSAGYFIKPRWLLSANFIYTSGLMTNRTCRVFIKLPRNASTTLYKTKQCAHARLYAL